MANFSKAQVYTGRIQLALLKATEWHKYQLRKDGTIYLQHLLRVMGMVMQFTSDEDIIIGALLHDCVEDVGISLDEIKKLFGDNVTDLIYFVTENDSLEETERKQDYIDGLKLPNCPPGSLLISIIDKYDNFINGYQYAPDLVSSKVVKFLNDLIDVYQDALDNNRFPNNIGVRSYRSVIKELRAVSINIM